jgi:hypothetical protein
MAAARQLLTNEADARTAGDATNATAIATNATAIATNATAISDEAARKITAITNEAQELLVTQQRYRYRNKRHRYFR